ncbi:hypothetical protein DF044_17455 [Burkholderia contaminans]|nr:hypothetical protein DF044_17455 [Burkholderia contaminans]
MGNGWIVGHCTGGARDGERERREARWGRGRHASCGTFIAWRKPLRCTSRCARRRFHASRAGIGPGGETR